MIFPTLTSTPSLDLSLIQGLNPAPSWAVPHLGCKPWSRDAIVPGPPRALEFIRLVACFIVKRSQWNTNFWHSVFDLLTSYPALQVANGAYEICVSVTRSDFDLLGPKVRKLECWRWYYNFRRVDPLTFIKNSHKISTSHFFSVHCASEHEKSIDFFEASQALLCCPYDKNNIKMETRQAMCVWRSIQAVSRN